MLSYGMITLLSATLWSAPPIGGDSGGLNLAVRPYENTVVQGGPLVLRIVLENRGDATRHMYFKRGSSMKAYDLFTLYAVDAQGREHTLKPLRLLAGDGARAPGAPFPPGARLETDHVMCLQGLAGGDGQGVTNGPHFLPPGRYRVYGALRCPPVVQSEPFELTVAEAQGEDARVLEILPKVPYYAQGVSRTPGPDATWACGGDPDEVRRKLRYIREECPNSVFSLWVDYWDTFYAMRTKDVEEGTPAVERALKFANEHESFPLADNLLFQAVKSLTRLDDAQRAREVLETAIARYPQTDVSSQEVAELRYKIDEQLFRAKEKKERQSSTEKAPDKP